MSNSTSNPFSSGGSTVYGEKRKFSGCPYDLDLDMVDISCAASSAGSVGHSENPSKKLRQNSGASFHGSAQQLGKNGMLCQFVRTHQTALKMFLFLKVNSLIISFPSLKQATSFQPGI